MIRWQSGEEDKTQNEFSEQHWGAKSLQYAKSVMYLSKAKLDEIFLAAHRYLKVKACVAFALTSGINEDDDSDYDEWSRRSPSNDLDENGPNTATGEERNAGNSDFYPVTSGGEGAKDEGMHCMRPEGPSGDCSSLLRTAAIRHAALPVV